MQQSSSVILGIDPGTLVMGFGLIHVDKSKVSLIEMGVLKLAKKQSHPERLEMIFRKIQMLIDTHQPFAVAIEAPFYGKNVQSMLKLGRAQGVAMAAAMVNGLIPMEYAPRRIKQMVTGRGNASKEQVWKMLQQILGFHEDPRFMDATDAVAAAVCHHYETHREFPSLKPKSLKKQSWSDFVLAHPERIK